jgi:hypothetical protein
MVKQVLWGWRMRLQWDGGGGDERDGRMNMMQTMYTHVCKCKNDTC